MLPQVREGGGGVVGASDKHRVEIDAAWDGDMIIASITDVVPAPEQKSEAE